MSQLSSSDIPIIPFSCRGLCCPNLERWLFKHRCGAILIGCVIYLPLLLIIQIIWLPTVILTIIINIFVILLCCNWRPHRKLLNIQPPRDKHKYGIMLEGSGLEPGTESDTKPDTERNKTTQVSILTFNVFGHYDKFWRRYPLLIRSLKQNQADIICIQECITTKFWDFGTLQTLKRINPTYDGFHISIYEMFTNYHQLLFRYSFLWPIIIELQLLLQVHFCSPFWKGLMWKLALGGNSFARYVYSIFTGAAAHFGNAISFKNSIKLNYKLIIYNATWIQNCCKMFISCQW